MSDVLFLIFGGAACAGALGVVLERNVVRMAFWLVVALGSTAGLFFLLGADFVGATQLLIYVGGTVVLLIFGVMLTATGPIAKYLKIERAEYVLAGVVAVSFMAILGVTILSVDWGIEANNPTPFSAGGTTRPLGLKLLGIDVDAVDGRSGRHVGYLLPFEIASMHLLVVLVGAAYLARAKYRRRNDLREGKR